MVDDEQTHSLPDDEAGARRASPPSSAIADARRFPGRAAATAAPRRGPLCRAVRGGAEPRRPGGNLVFTGTDDDPDTLRDAAGARLPRCRATSAGVVRGWHHGRYRATRIAARARAADRADAGAAARRCGETRRARPGAAATSTASSATCRPACSCSRCSSPIPALLELVADDHGQRAAARRASRAPHRAARFGAVARPSIGRCRRGRADGATSPRCWRRSSDEQDILDAARRWTNDRRFQIGVQLLQARSMRPAQAGLAFSDIADADDRGAVRPASSSRLRRAARQRSAASGWRSSGMGKLGSREMSATSDLDLIFLYDIPPEPRGLGRRRSRWRRSSTTRGSAPRSSTALTAPTDEGALYEVDMRLRPSGNAGPLANSLEGFENYQRSRPGPGSTWR